MEKKLTKKNIILTVIAFLLSQLLLFYCVFFIGGKGLRATGQEIAKNGIIRVGISTQDFSKLEYDKVSITSEGEFLINEKSSGTSIAKLNCNQIINISINYDKITISDFDNKKIAENINDDIVISPLSNYPLEVFGLKRAAKPAQYKGIIEIAKSPSRKNLFSVVNVLPLEEYLKGVVPNEMPVSFGLEALKAQTIAARNYAIRPRANSYKQFDICDSVQCQVYFGSNTEKPLSNQAILETKGLTGLYNSDLILALYSSTAGGYTESYDNAFTDPANNNEFVKPLPYLKGKPDICGLRELNDDESAYNFYTSYPNTFDVKSSYYRWERHWAKNELEEILTRNLLKQSKSGLIQPKFEEKDRIKNLLSIEVTERGVSGKAKTLKISAENGEWIVKKELTIRRVIEKEGKALPSANIAFKNEYDNDGNLSNINIFGGGYGHGVGMSQFGAGYLSLNGWSFDKILKHYYDGISIGTSPIKLNSSIVSPVFSEFYSPNKKIRLNIENTVKPKRIVLSLNGTLLEIPDLHVKKDLVKVNLDKFARKGNNTIVYYPLDKTDFNKNVKIWVEVIEADNNE